jgi:hypothetical protein
MYWDPTVVPCIHIELRTAIPEQTPPKLPQTESCGVWSGRWGNISPAEFSQIQNPLSGQTKPSISLLVTDPTFIVHRPSQRSAFQANLAKTSSLNLVSMVAWISSTCTTDSFSASSEYFGIYYSLSSRVATVDLRTNEYRWPLFDASYRLQIVPGYHNLTCVSYPSSQVEHANVVYCRKMMSKKRGW